MCPNCGLLFTTPTGCIWRERTFYRDLWKPAQEASGLDIRPHECRHSYVSHLRAAGVNDADLAEIVWHRIETMLARYMQWVSPLIPFDAQLGSPSHCHADGTDRQQSPWPEKPFAAAHLA